MEAAIKTWIQPLPDPSSNNKFRGVTSTRLPHILLPMLFNIFINNIVEKLECGDADPVLVGDISINCLLYADDLVLLSSSPCGLQTCLDTLYEFRSCWKLEVNNSHSKVLIFN